MCVDCGWSRALRRRRLARSSPSTTRSPAPRRLPWRRWAGRDCAAPGTCRSPQIPSGFARRTPTRRPYNLGFVGAHSQRRALFLERVTDLGLGIWGSDWDVQGGSDGMRSSLRDRTGLFGARLVRCYQDTALFINVQRKHMVTQTEDGRTIGTGLGFRHFDVPACGGLVLSEEVLELPDAFEVGREVETFSTPEELREKAQYLLGHEAERDAMSRRAYVRVLQDHTYLQRARQWVAWLGGTS